MPPRPALRATTLVAAAAAWMVAADSSLVTHPLTPAILGGVTRATVLDLAHAAGHPVHERPFTLDEALSAREIFLTGTTTFVMPVVQVGEMGMPMCHWRMPMPVTVGFV